MGIHINEGYHGNLIVEYVNERGVSHPFCTLLKNGDSYQVYINTRMPVMSVEEFFEVCYGITDYIDDSKTVNITSPNFSSLTQKDVEHLKGQGILMMALNGVAADLKRLQDDSLDDIVDNNTLDKYHHVPFTKQQLIDLHDSLCETRTNNQGMYQQEVMNLITYLDYLIDNLP